MAAYCVAYLTPISSVGVCEFPITEKPRFPSGLQYYGQRLLEVEPLAFALFLFAKRIDIKGRIGGAFSAVIHNQVPDYALSSAIKAWYKTGTYGCFCGFERIRSQGRPEPCFQVGQHHPRQLDEAVMHTRPALSRLG